MIKGYVVVEGFEGVIRWLKMVGDLEDIGFVGVVGICSEVVKIL